MTHFLQFFDTWPELSKLRCSNSIDNQWPSTKDFVIGNNTHPTICTQLSRQDQRPTRKGARCTCMISCSFIGDLKITVCARYLYKYISIHNIQFIIVSQYMDNIHQTGVQSCVIHHKRPVGFKRLHIPDLFRKIYNFHDLRIMCFVCFSL